MSQLHKIKCCLFDFGGTLFYMSPSSEETFQRFLRQENYRFSLEEIKKGIEKANRYYEESIVPQQKKENRYRTTEKEWIKYDTIVLKHLGIEDMELGKAIQERWNQYMVTPTSKVKPFPEACAVLEHLKCKGLILGVISNTEQNFRNELEQHRMLDLFSTVLLSYEEKSRKPESDMFIKACKELGVKPEECIYVGDEWDKDVKGAKKVGIHPVWIRRKNSSNSDETPASNINVDIIHHLTELVTLLNKGREQ